MHLPYSSNLITKQNNFLALFLAIMLHGAILLNHSGKPHSLEIKKQIINVSLVAKSSISSKNENLFHLSKNHLKNQDQSRNQKLINKKTTGKVDINATATNSAIVEPIFDANHLNNPSPIYPEIARQRGIEGEVVLKVRVSKIGKPIIIDIFKSSGSQILDITALETIKKWQFIPAKQNNKIVEADVMVPIIFKII
jgi:TonB family protein